MLRNLVEAWMLSLLMLSMSFITEMPLRYISHLRQKSKGHTRSALIRGIFIYSEDPPALRLKSKLFNLLVGYSATHKVAQRR